MPDLGMNKGSSKKVIFLSTEPSLVNLKVQKVENKGCDSLKLIPNLINQILLIILTCSKLVFVSKYVMLILAPAGLCPLSYTIKNNVEEKEF